MQSASSLLVVACSIAYVAAEWGVITRTDPPPPVGCEDLSSAAYCARNKRDGYCDTPLTHETMWYWCRKTCNLCDSPRKGPAPASGPSPNDPSPRGPSQGGPAMPPGAQDGPAMPPGAL
ncbi:hypothetical protein AAVH_13133 [Aphelenchoides avenae]|nr:hypothetical protein AAVH_31326 [Aphelenchus avenae]KAH7719458.1 hypothetical protein AAVH_13133 [Aphelenchus avenae]